MSNNLPDSCGTMVADVFVWDSHLETGIPDIDQQHREMVRLINQMGRMQFAERPLESFSHELLHVLDELAACVEHHFGFEEAFMGRYYEDPDHCSTHSHGHADFNIRMAEARSAALNYPSSVACRMLTFLSRWLISHIIGTDMHMAKKILAIQAGMSEAEATCAADRAMSDTSAHMLASMDKLYEWLSRRTHDLVELKTRYDQEIIKRRRAEDDLRMIWRAVEHSPMSVIITDAEGVIEYINPKFSELTGYTLEEVMGQTPRILKSGQTSDDKYVHMWRTLSSGQEWHGQLCNRKKNGDLYWESVAISPVQGDGKVTHYIAIQENITEQKVAEEALYDQKQFSDDVINGLPGIFYMLNAEGRFVRVNRQFLGSSGYTREEFSSMSALDFFTGEDRVQVAEWIKDTFTRGSARCQAEFANKSGRTTPYDFTGLRSFIDGKPYLVGLGIDITERRQLEHELARQASTDHLTGVFNRRHFMVLAEQEFTRSIRYGKQLSVLMLDLDRFKQINDNYGHAAGDMALRKVGEIALRALRETDILGRLGGEEFAVMLPETHIMQAREIAERLRLEISRCPVILEDGQALSFSASIGIATLTAWDTSLEKLLSRSDQAMYQAKHTGRNRVMLAE